FYGLLDRVQIELSILDGGHAAGGFDRARLRIAHAVGELDVVFDRLVDVRDVDHAVTGLDRDGRGQGLAAAFAAQNVQRELALHVRQLDRSLRLVRAFFFFVRLWRRLLRQPG